MNGAAPCIMMLAVAFAVWSGDSLPGSGVDAETGAFFHRLVSSGRADKAALEYERLLFYGVADSFGLACALGGAHLRLMMAENAEATFERAFDMAGNPAQKAQAEAGLQRAYLMNRKPALARSDLNGLDSATRAELGDDAKTFFTGLSFSSAYRVDSARAWLREIQSGSRYGTAATRVDSLLGWYRSQQMKNPLYAYLYSSAVPGWGHWYVGDRKKAVASFCLMAGLSSLLCYEGYRFYRGDPRERYVRGMDMFLVWGLAWRRYYAGIRKASHRRAAEKNRDIQLEYQERLKRILAEE